MNELYRTIGISKQGIHQYAKRQDVFNRRVGQMLIEADELRKEHPGCGVEKMYWTLNPGFIGRDRFVEIMMQTGYRLKRKKNYKRTTHSSSLWWPNLIKGMKINQPSGVWQSDITYIEVKGTFYYAVFLIDVYTKIITGYQVSDHMRATANLQALNMALKNHTAPQIHHSDRGSQYICKSYVELLKDNECEISMADKAPDNAYAERINRTIKEEYLNYWKPKNLGQLKHQVKKAVNHYNNKRPHDNLDRMTPNGFEAYWKELAINDRPVIEIFDDQQGDSLYQHPIIEVYKQEASFQV